MVFRERHSERFPFYDAVETELLPLVDWVDADDVAQLLDDVRHDRRRLRVDHALSPAGKSENESLVICDIWLWDIFKANLVYLKNCRKKYYFFFVLLVCTYFYYKLKLCGLILR